MIPQGIVPMWVIAFGLAGQPAPAPNPTPTLQPPIQPADPAPEQFARRLAAADAAMAKVFDLRADFEQRRRTPLLKHPLISKGTVLTKGDLVRWDTTSPRASTLMIGRGSIRMYYPADNLVEVYPVGEGFKDLAGAPLPRLSVLKERFEIAPIPPADPALKGEDPTLLGVLLTPKGADLRTHVTTVKVLIDESGPAARKVTITDPEGEETDIIFTRTRLNTGVRTQDIDLTLPDNVRVSKPLGEGHAPAGDAEPPGAPR